MYSVLGNGPKCQLMNDFQKTQGKNLKKFAPEKCLNGKINKGTIILLNAN